MEKGGGGSRRVIRMERGLEEEETKKSCQKQSQFHFKTYKT